jgi:ligand-binding sensor protein
MRFPDAQPPDIKIALTDIIGITELQEMQESFSEVANVPIRTTDAHGNFATQISHTPALCADVFKTGKSHYLHGSCLPTFLGGEGIVDDELSYECIPGLKHYLIPLRVSLSAERSLILGYMVIGPVIFMKRKEKNAYAPSATVMGMELDQLWDCVLELRVFSYKGMRSFLDMVDNLMRRILDLAYVKFMMQHQMEEKTPKAALAKVPAAVGLQDFLELFLDLVMDITNGNRGSVMLLDRKARQLRIRAAHNLPPDVVTDTSVPLGAGVSGLAAETKKAFLINDKSSDPLISDRLSNPQLFSSLVVPIKHGEDVFGVLNVSSDRALPVRFDESTLALVTRASCVAGVVLRKFQS